LLFNVLIACSANLSPSLKRFWSIKKVYFFFIGFFIYLLILILSKLSIYVFVDLKEVDQNDLYSLSGNNIIEKPFDSTDLVALLYYRSSKSYNLFKVDGKNVKQLTFK